MSPVAKTVAILGGALVVAAVAISLVFVAFVKLAEKDFVAGEAVYLRDIYVVIDQTLSMASNQRREAKMVANEEILSVMGLGDRAFCYRIADKFQESNDRVFSSPRNLPRVWQNIAGMPLAEIPEDFTSRLQSAWTRFDQQRQTWRRHLDSLDAPRNRFSDYLGTISDIGRRITDGDDPHLAENKWLVVIGDLKHEPVPDAPPAPTPAERRQFSSVEIYLVHPGGVFDQREQQRIDQFWQRFFAARGNPRINILTFDAFIGRFPASSVPRPARASM